MLDRGGIAYVDAMSCYVLICELQLMFVHSTIPVVNLKVLFVEHVEL